MSRDAAAQEEFDAEFAALLGDLPSSARIARMGGYRQHGVTSTLDHAVSVARRALAMARRLRLRVDGEALVRGALLHDYYLYDWHDSENRAHAVNHPVIALRNAEGDFDLSQKERNIISSHMWPLPPTRIPQSKEAWLVCLADKLCSMDETIRRR